MAPPKRQLALTGAGAVARREAAKRLRVGIFTGASGSASAAGNWPVAPASPGERMMRQTVLVVLFLVRMIDARTTVAESMSQMFQKFLKVQTRMMRKLENLEEKVEGVCLEVKKLARLLSNRQADQQPRQEPCQESASMSGSNTNFHLRFLSGLNLKTPIYTEKKITSERNSPIKIGIFDGDVMISEGPLSKVKVEMLVLRGDFCNDGRKSWTEEEFNSHIAQGRHGPGFVLGGDCSVWLNNGEASFGGAIRFKEGSSRTRSRMFIVAARICKDGKTSDRVREAVMMPVTVLDRRNEANEKRHPPKLDDEVYRLEEISKDGTYHKRLQNAQISTVGDFLKAMNKDANKLREEVLQMKKLNNSWEKMVKHARECCLTDNPELIAYRNEAAKKALANELKERAHDEVGSTPFSHVMNGTLPVPVSSNANPFVSMPILDPDVAFQGSRYEHHDRTNHVTEPSHHNENVHGDQNILAPDETLEANGIILHDRMINHVTEPSQHNEYVHGDQNTVDPHYYYQDEGIPPLSEQQPTAFATSSEWDIVLSDLLSEGSGQVNMHSQMQVPMSMDGGSMTEASTSAQNNLLRQQFHPTQFHESIPGMHYPEVVPNSAAEASTWHANRLPGPGPSAYPFQGTGYGSI